MTVLLAYIALTPRTREEIVAHTGLQKLTVTQWVKILNTVPGKNNVIYVYDHVRPSGRGKWIERFLIGYGMPNAPRPKRVPNSVHCKNYRRRKNASN